MVRYGTYLIRHCSRCGSYMTTELIWTNTGWQEIDRCLKCDQEPEPLRNAKVTTIPMSQIPMQGCHILPQYEQEKK